MKFKVGDKVKHKITGDEFFVIDEISIDGDGLYIGVGSSENVLSYYVREYNLEIINPDELKTGQKALFWDDKYDEKYESIFLFKSGGMYYATMDSEIKLTGEYEGFQNCEPIKEVTKEEAIEALNDYFTKDLTWEEGKKLEIMLKQYILNN